MLNLFKVPINLARLSKSSRSAWTDITVSVVSIKLFIMNENIATPISRTNAIKNCSNAFTGAKSPKPTVDNEVKE